MEITALLETKGKLHNQMTALLEKSKSEKRDFTTEESETWDKLNAEYTRTDQTVQREQSEQDASRALAADRFVVRTITGKSADEQLTHAEQWRLAFCEYMRRGRDMSPQARIILDGAEERWPMVTRQQATTPGSAGGFLTNEEFSGEVAQALKRFGGMRQFGRVINTATGSTLNWPLLDETNELGGIVDENQPIAEQDMTFGQKQIGAFKYTSGQVLISWELLQDALVDPVNLIQDALVNRIGRVQNDHFTTGGGTTEPEGIVPAAPTVDASLAGAIDQADILGLFHAVDPAYRADASSAWMMNDAIAAAVRQIATGAGSVPLWAPSLERGVPDLLLGRPIVYNPSMTTSLAVGQVPILFGAGNRYLIRDVAPIRVLRLNEINALNGQVTFVAWSRSDGAPLIPETTVTEWAVKGLEMPA